MEDYAEISGCNLGELHGQWTKRNPYCPKCHVTTQPHVDGCNGIKVRISTSARVPRKNASKKVWDRFYKKFVLQEDLKEKIKQIDKEKLKLDRINQSRNSQI